LYSYQAKKNKQAIGIPPALINQNLNLDNPDLKKSSYVSTGRTGPPGQLLKCGHTIVVQAQTTNGYSITLRLKKLTLSG